MVHSKDKELEVALELFNAELEKQKSKEKEIAVVKKAEKRKTEAVKALQEAEKNPDLSKEEKEAAKAVWLKADDDLKRILAGEEPLAEEETKAEEPVSEDTEEPQAEEETKAEEPVSEDTEEPQAEEETKAEEPASEDTEEPQAEEEAS